MTVDLEKVKAAGYDIITPMLICNTADYAAVTAQADKEVNAGDDVLTVEENSFIDMVLNRWYLPD